MKAASKEQNSTNYIFNATWGFFEDLKLWIQQLMQIVNPSEYKNVFHFTSPLSPSDCALHYSDSSVPEGLQNRTASKALLIYLYFNRSIVISYYSLILWGNNKRKRGKIKYFFVLSGQSSLWRKIENNSMRLSCPAVTYVYLNNTNLISDKILVYIVYI